MLFNKDDLRPVCDDLLFEFDHDTLEKSDAFLSLSYRAFKIHIAVKREGDDLLELGKFLFRDMHGVPTMEKSARIKVF